MVAGSSPVIPTVKGGVSAPLFFYIFVSVISQMNLRPSFIKTDTCKRFALILCLSLIAVSFLNKNVLSDYCTDTSVNFVELMENGGEEQEPEREEVKEEIDDYTSTLIYAVLKSKVEIEYALDFNTIWNNRYNEVLTPPPDKL